MAALRAFFAQEGDFVLSAVLMDDGSADQTSEAVRNEFDAVEVLRGDGTLFWNRGMAAAYEAARAANVADHYLWLNDDTLIYANTLNRLVEDSKLVANGGRAIIVGSTLDPEEKCHTYGGLITDSYWHPGKFRRLEPLQERMLPCATMNGNIVLISRQAADSVGGIDLRFSHSMGDFDYGLRASRLGIPVWIGSGYHGECPRNPYGSSWVERATIRERYKVVNTPKGLPMREWAYFLRKHGNAMWPLYWLSTYRRIFTG